MDIDFEDGVRIEVLKVSIRRIANIARWPLFAGVRPFLADEKEWKIAKAACADAFYLL